MNLFDIQMSPFFEGFAQGFDVFVNDRPWDLNLEVGLSKKIDDKEFSSVFLVRRDNFEEAIKRTAQTMAMINGWIEKHGGKKAA